MNATALEVARLGLSAPDLLAYCTVGPERFQRYRHIRYIGWEIARAVARGNARLLINMGPRHGKSELLSLWTPVWFQTVYPHRRVLLAANTSPLAADFGSRVRNTFTENPKLGVQLIEDTTAKAHWKTKHGGGMKAVGVGESVLGFGGDLAIVDDPYTTWADAQSPTVRKQVYDWFQGTFMSRLEPNASVIVLHHRMHPQDLTHQLVTGEDGSRWKHICLPSIAGDNDPLGRKPGEALCPERYDEDALHALRRSMQAKFEVMHQQNPTVLSVGGAYHRFSPANVSADCQYTPALPLDLSIDFNISPGMYLALGQNDPLADQVWDFDEIFSPRLSVDGAMVELARRIDRMPVKPSAIHVYGDAAGVSKWAGTGQSQYDLLCSGLDRMGIPYRLRVPNANPPIVDRVMTANFSMKDIDGHIRYRCHPRCERLIRDWANVQVDPRKDGGGIDKSDPELTHASDAVTYRLYRLRGQPTIDLPIGQFHY